ncbi:uncharacterized protein UV8b_01534 [Ustilaginoidea virens]|uniref:Uncharacterized protein n=1 Tax=Ustilaginoidea virens TaxID=1159556 RepID=A0A8E5HL59_USTVR|nr:uncharacterized protein UV8b_01534 [Ustilaginoidea virens]QUC17293.1 hypothetical protein UV8b_01534 [Ustilaginoidea virens]
MKRAIEDGMHQVYYRGHKVQYQKPTVSLAHATLRKTVCGITPRHVPRHHDNPAWAAPQYGVDVDDEDEKNSIHSFMVACTAASSLP